MYRVQKGIIGQKKEKTQPNDLIQKTETGFDSEEKKEKKYFQTGIQERCNNSESVYF